jgi:hypothetical protein
VNKDQALADSTGNPVIADYHRQRLEVARRVDALGRGSRFRAARGCDTHSTLVSSTLNGVLYRPDLLDRLEAWVAGLEGATDGPG